VIPKKDEIESQISRFGLNEINELNKQTYSLSHNITLPLHFVWFPKPSKFFILSFFITIDSFIAVFCENHQVMERSKKDLIRFVFSWSLQDILNDHLFTDRVSFFLYSFTLFNLIYSYYFYFHPSKFHLVNFIHQCLCPFSITIM
jgi:hypothetical protein